MQIEKHEFQVWLNNPITLKLIDHFINGLKKANEELADENFLMENDVDKWIGYKVGYKACIQHILYDVLQQQEESQDDLQTDISTLWSPSIGEIEGNS